MLANEHVLFLWLLFLYLVSFSLLYNIRSFTFNANKRFTRYRTWVYCVHCWTSLWWFKPKVYLVNARFINLKIKDKILSWLFTNSYQEKPHIITVSRNTCVKFSSEQSRDYYLTCIKITSDYVSKQTKLSWYEQQQKTEMWRHLKIFLNWTIMMRNIF
jgi:hypothetical protein